MSRLPIRTLGDITPLQNLPTSSSSANAVADKPSASRLPLSSQSVNQAQTRRFLNALNLQQLRRADVLPAFLQMAGLLPTEGRKTAPWTSHSIVDLSCDDGEVSFLLHDLLPLSTVLGIDLSMKKVQDLRQKRTALLKEEGRWTPAEFPDPDPDLEEFQHVIIMFHQLDYHQEKLFELIRGPPPDGPHPDGPNLFGDGPPLGPALNTMSKPMHLKGRARAVVCTLHNRHVKLSTLLYTIKSLSHCDVAYVLMTGQHRDMLAVPDEDGQPSLQTYSVEEIISESKKWGFKPIRNWEKKLETADLVGQTGDEKWLSRKCWFAIALKLDVYKE